MLLMPVSTLAQELTPKKLYNQASNQFWDGKYEQSEASFRQIIKRFPGNSIKWDARFGLGRSLFKQGRIDDAAKHYRSVSRNHPDKSVRGDALFSLAEVSILQDRTVQARTFLRTFIDVYPDHVLKPTASEQLDLLKGENVDRDKSRAEKRSNLSRGSSSSDTAEESVDGPRLQLAEESREGEEILDESKKTQGPELGSDTNVMSKDPAQEEMEEQEESSDSKKRSQRDTESMNRRVNPFQSDQSDTSSQTKSDTVRKLIKPELPDKSNGNNGSDQTSGQSSRQPKESGEESDQIGRSGTSFQVEDVEKDSLKNNKKEESSAGKSENEPDAESSSNRASQDQSVSNESKGQRPSDMDEESPSEKSSSNEANLQRARVLYERGETQRAQSVLDSILESGQSSGEAYFLAARINQSQPDSTEAALDNINQAIMTQEDPPPEYRLLKASLLNDQRLFEESRKTLAKVNPEGFTNKNKELKSRYYYLMGNAIKGSGDSEEAFFHFMDSIRVSPSSSWAQKSRRRINS